MSSAVKYPGGGGGSPGAPPTGGGGGGGGPVHWFDIPNTGFDSGRGGDLRWSPKLDQIRASMQTPGTNSNSGGAKEVSSRLATREVLRPCGATEPYRGGSYCPLWFNRADTFSSTSHPRTWLEIHAASPEGIEATEDQLLGYNIKIWRENPRDKNWDLILQRQLGVTDHPTEHPAIRDSAKATRIRRGHFLPRVRSAVLGGRRGVPRFVSGAVDPEDPCLFIEARQGYDTSPKTPVEFEVSLLAFPRIKVIVPVYGQRGFGRQLVRQPEDFPLPVFHC